MNEEQRLLQVGDVVYSDKYGRLYASVIVRVTKTQAITNRGAKISLSPSGIFYRKIGAKGFNVVLYQLETQELKAKFYRQTLIDEFKPINPNKLTNEQILAINEIVKKPTKNE